MNQHYNVFILIGIIIFVVYSIIDRFFIDVPNKVAYPLIIFGIIMLLLGL